MDKNLYDLPPREQKKVPEVCGSLREALDNLDKDRGFLKKGGVMDDDFIDAYIELKMEEVMRLAAPPAPGGIRHVLQLLIAVRARRAEILQLRTPKCAFRNCEGPADLSPWHDIWPPDSGRRGHDLACR